MRAHLGARASAGVAARTVPDGFDAVLALADRLGAALGVFRVVTSWGWGPS